MDPSKFFNRKIEIFLALSAVGPFVVTLFLSSILDPNPETAAFIKSALSASFAWLATLVIAVPTTHQLKQLSEGKKVIWIPVPHASSLYLTREQTFLLVAFEALAFAAWIAFLAFS